MKTLKKTLCLVLAVVMMVGTLAVAASATAFVDDAEIKYAEAVEVLTGLGVINGTDGNKFDPKGTLTREQAAKIITYIMLGADEEEIEAVEDATAQVFADVAADRWSAGYIQYLYNKGVIAGVGDGKFAPEASLSAAAFEKMLLVALGFDAEFEGFNNSNWVQNVSSVAKEANTRVDGIKIKDAAITREEACALAFQAVTEGYLMGTYGAGSSISIGGVAIESGKTRGTIDDTTTLLAENFKVDVDPDVVIETNQANSTDDKTNTDYDVETGLDLIGHTVDIYYKTVDGEKVGVAVVDKTTVVTVAKDLEEKTAAEVKTLFGLTDAPAANVVVTGTVDNYTVDTGSTTAVTYTSAKDCDVAAGTYFVANGAITHVKTDDYVVSVVEAYTAPTEKADGSVTITGLEADATEGTTEEITLKDLKDEDTTDAVTLYDGIAAGDYVYLQVCGTAPLKVTKAETVVGVVSAYNKGDVDSIVIGGVTYDVSAVADIASLGAVNAGLISKDTKVTFILDQAGAVVASADYNPDSTADSYAVVLDIDSKNGEDASAANGYTATYATVYVYALLADGTKTTLTYTSETNTVGTDAEAELTGITAGDVVKYAAKAGVITEINEVTETATAYAIEAKTAKVAAGAYLTAATPIVYFDATDISDVSVKVITGYAAADEATAGEAFFVTDDNGIIVVFVAKAYVGEPEETTTVAYIPAALTAGGYVSTKYDAALEANIFGYTVYVDGVATTLWSEEDDLTASAGFVNYTITDGYLTAISNSFDGLDAADGEIGFIDGTVVDVAGTQLTYAGVKVITDSAANGVSAGGSLAKEATIVGLKNADGVLVYAAIDAE